MRLWIHAQISLCFCVGPRRVEQLQVVNVSSSQVWLSWLVQAARHAAASRVHVSLLPSDGSEARTAVLNTSTTEYTFRSGFAFCFKRTQITHHFHLLCRPPALVVSTKCAALWMALGNIPYIHQGALFNHSYKVRVFTVVHFCISLPSSLLPGQTYTVDVLTQSGIRPDEFPSTSHSAGPLQFWTSRLHHLVAVSIRD